MFVAEREATQECAVAKETRNEKSTRLVWALDEP